MSATANLLIELGSEELPPKALLKLSEAFTRGVTQRLKDARLEHGAVTTYATPRRLALHITDLAAEQPTQTIEHRGPPVDRAFADDGSPTRAAEAFAEKCGVAIDALERQKTPKGEWLYFTGEQSGQPTTALLEDIVAAALAALPIPKRMRWGNSEVEFVRPVHWFVMLLDKQVVAATVLGLKADRVTHGHRFHAPGALKLKHADDYAQVLLDKGKVIANFAERRNQILAMAKRAAKTAGGEAVLSTAVVDEVTALVEWPVPVTGKFPEQFLQLPDEVLISTLQDHQKYFPVRTGQKLLPAFIAIANLDSKDPQQVQAGNERVVLPRLADAEFFWNQDTRQKLADRQTALDAVVYQKGLGSLRDKSIRVAELVTLIAPLVNANTQDAQRAAALAKTDLLTDMVGEFPELQGRMGFYYATHDGESPAVAAALEEQYLPRHASDALPQSATGTALSLADRLDTLAGIFALGKKPSGNKDPFALRRQALGMVRIAVGNAVDMDLPAMLQAAVNLQPINDRPADLAQQLYDFVLDRARAWYLDGQAPGLAAGQVTAELFQAVRGHAPASLLDLHQRLLALAGFMQLDEADSLAAANKRIANILKSADSRSGAPIDENLFADDAERQLFAAVAEILPAHRNDLQSRDYSTALKRLAKLRAPVDTYFDEVMVMADNEKQRNNRLAQLSLLRELFLDIADISALPTQS